MPRGWAGQGGSTRAWLRRKAEVIERDGRRCQLRIEGVCTKIATTAHHTVGKSVTGDDPRYLVAACQPCNLKVGDPTKADPEPRPWGGW
jgi:5-methylcytosine-specific restriction endonuclease McrA